MDLQGLYESIANFWNTIFPVLVAHLFFLSGWFWVTGSRVNLLVTLEAVLESKYYQRWKKILDEFQLRPTLPYLTLFLLLVYLVVLGNAVEFIAGGLLSPFSIYYNEPQFWLETNNRLIVDQIIELYSYQSNPSATVWDVSGFKNKMLETYSVDRPELYKAFFDWQTEKYKLWNTYYQFSITGFLIFSVMLIPYVRKKITKLSIKRLWLVWLLSLLLIPMTRYQAEQVLEKRLNMELIFVNMQLGQDEAYAGHALGQSEGDDFACQFYNDKRSEMHARESGNDTRSFWLSRYLEPVFMRVFTTAPEMWQPPADCVVVTP